MKSGQQQRYYVTLDNGRSPKQGTFVEAPDIETAMLRAAQKMGVSFKGNAAFMNALKVGKAVSA